MSQTELRELPPSFRLSHSHSVEGMVTAATSGQDSRPCVETETENHSL